MVFLMQLLKLFRLDIMPGTSYRARQAHASHEKFMENLWIVKTEMKSLN